MKILGLIYCFVLTLFQISSSQAAWYWQNPLPQANTLYDVEYLDSNNLVAVGVGTIIKSNDGGITWSTQLMDNSLGMVDICFLNRDTVIAVGEGIYRSTDGGMNWSKVVQVGATNLLKGVSFSGPLTGIAVGDNNMILETTDAGKTWTQQNPPFYIYCTSVFFVNSDTGFITNDWANVHILSTDDGGATWDTSYMNEPRSSFYSTYFLNTSYGIAVGATGRIVSTINGGKDWVVQNLPEPILNDLLSVCILKSGKAFVVGTGGTIFSSNDSGKTWEPGVSGTTKHLRNVSFYDNQKGVIVGDSNTILHTMDGGLTWTMRSSGQTNDLSDVCFVDLNTAYAVGYGGAILSTFDGGDTWSYQYSGSPYSIQNVLFKNAKEGFTLSGPSLFSTFDSGRTWSQKNIDVTGYNYYPDACFVDSSTIIIVGSKIQKSLDGGNSWVIKKEDLQRELNGVCFFDDSSGIAVGGNGNIFLTKDKGETWVAESSGTGQILNSASFSDNKTGIVVGQSGTILRTVDGGEHWSLQTLGIYVFNDVCFVDDNNGIIVGGGGSIYSTSDGGQNWIKQICGTRYTLRRVSFVDQYNGMIVGEGGTILRTNNGGVTWIDQSNNIGEIQRADIVNFPNPFNPITTIRVRFERPEYTVLRICNIKGQVISTLLAEQVGSGTRDIIWDASQMAAGVYFCQLKTKGNVQNIKLILIR